MMKKTLMLVALEVMLGVIPTQQRAFAHDGERKAKEKTTETKVVDSAKDHATKEKPGEKNTGMPMKNDMKGKMTEKVHDKTGGKPDDGKSSNASFHGHSDKTNSHTGGHSY